MLCMLVAVAGCIVYRYINRIQSKNRTQMELCVVVLVPDLPLLISVSSLAGVCNQELVSLSQDHQIEIL